METGVFSKRKSAVILITAGCIGFAFVVYRTVVQSQTETFEVNLPLTAIAQAGLLSLSVILMTIGVYLTGYRRGSRGTHRITMDFSKKLDSSAKGTIG